MEAQKAAEAEAARIEADRIARAKKRGGLLRRSLTKVSPTSRTSLPTNSLLSIDLGVDSPRRRESGISPVIKGLAVSPAARGVPIEDRQTPKVADGGANGRYTGEELELSEKDERDEDSNSLASNKSDLSQDELLVEGNAAANGEAKEAKPNFVLRLESTVSNEAITPLKTQNLVSQRNSSAMMVDSEAANTDGAQRESQYGS